MFITSSCSVQEDDLLNDDLESFIQPQPVKKVPGDLKVKTGEPVIPQKTSGN